MIRLLVVDDETLVRQALVSLLSLNDDIQVVAQAANGEEALRAIDSGAQIDAVLMDIQMPVLNGVEALRLIKEKLPHIAVLMLTTYDTEQLIQDAMRAGAGGYLMKDAGADQIAAALRAIVSGYTTLSDNVAAKLLTQISNQRKQPESKQSLTPRELEILRLLADGRTNREIAQALGISEKTVRDHIVNILTQLNLATRTQAALWAKTHVE